VAPGPEPQVNAPDVRGRAHDVLRRSRLTLVVAVAIAAVFIGWEVIGSGSSPTNQNSTTKQSSTPSPNPIGPVGLSASGLQTLATAVGQPIYWAGAKEGYLYELTRTRAGNVYIRYLPPGTNVGAKGANYLVVVTYPFGGALQALKNVADGHEIAIPGGGIALVDQNYPKSVHLAYPNSEYQIEVYDPSPARSLEVARSGDVRPVQ
jgi:hypothetical protein